MKNKKKQIEELAQCKNFYGLICSSCGLKLGCDRYRLAKEIYDKNSVVLSREEYESDLTLQYDTGYEFGSKETAEKILCEIKQEIFNYFNVKSMIELDNLSLLDSLLSYDVITDKLNEIAKQYGVDIKE